MGHPEGTYSELTSYDDEVWDLKTYASCLSDWDILNECMDLTQKELASNYASVKHVLRYEGLTILREVDTGDNHD